jgi:hypothetical protein
MAGGYFGVDFTDYVGIRAYYFQALENEEISTDFDGLNKYGIEFRAKLNDGRGVNPYLILGGGYLNVQSDYIGVVDGFGAQSTGFANAGLGLDIPLGRNVLITGGARAMATSSRDITNTIGPDVLQTHVMYNAGIKIQVGRRPENPTEITSVESGELDILEREITGEDEKAYERIQLLIREYQQDLKKIDAEIEKAYQQKNTQNIIGLLEDKKRVSKELRDVERLERMYNRKGFQNEGEYLKMTPEEFENLIDRILKGIDEKYKQETKAKNQVNVQSFKSDTLAQEILQLRKNIAEQNEIIEASTEQQKQDTANAMQPISDSISANLKAEKELELVLQKTNERQQQMDERLKDLDKRIEEFNKQLEQQKKELAKAKEVEEAKIEANIEAEKKVEESKEKATEEKKEK